MTDEHQLDDHDDDDLFNQFAEASDNGTSASNVGLDANAGATEEEEALSDDRLRDDKGRFASAGDTELESDPGEEDGDPLPEAAEAEPETDWKQKAADLEHRYKSDLGRQNALQRKIAEQEQQIQALKAEPVKRENPEGSGMSDGEWEALKKDFPEIAAGVESRLNAVTQSYQSKIDSLERQVQPMQQYSEEQFKQAQYQILEQHHPDWRDVSRSNEYRSWITEQPPLVQKMMSSNNAADAGWLLDQYKLSSGAQQKQQQSDELKAKREQQLRSAQTVSRRGVTNQDLQDPSALFDHFAEKADRSKRRA